MKHFHKIFSMSLLIAVLGTFLFFMLPEVQATTGTEGYYSYYISDGEAKITACEIAISGNVVIPDTLGGCPVTVIGRGAFYNCRNITNVQIPKSIRSIEASAFAGCVNLKQITIPDNVTSLGAEVFSECSKLERAVIGDGIITIPNNAFYHCGSLSDITIGSGVKHTGSLAFCGCPIEKVNIYDLKAWCECHFDGWDGNPLTVGHAKLYVNNVLVTDLVIPNGVTSISGDAFRHASIQSVRIPKSVKSIGVGALSIYKLRSVIIEGDITIQTHAFSEYGSIGYIFFGGSQITIEKNAFGNSDTIKHILYAGTEENWKGLSIGSGNNAILAATIHFECDGSEINKLGNCGYFCSICKEFLDSSVNHTWDSGTVTKQPTCKDEGIKTYTCSSCNGTKTETVAKTNKHSFGNWTEVDGDTHERTCTICQKEEKATHTWDAGQITKQSTCAEEGVKTYTCSICQGTKTESVAKATEHKYSSWTVVNDSTHKQTCTICQKEEEAAHVWDNGQITKQPTCAEKGVKTYTCSVCMGTKTESVAKTIEHKYTSWTMVDEENHMHVCSLCGVEEAQTHDWKPSQILKQPTCTQEGTQIYTCTICQGSKEMTIPATGHSWQNATCETAKTCASCGQSEGGPLNHSFSEWTQIKAPTDTETGMEERVCSVCGQKEQHETPKLDPTPTEPQTTKPTKEPNDDDGNATIIIAVCAAIGGLGIGGAAVLIVLKKKK